MIDEEYHVVPSDDDRKHNASHDCWCDPDVVVQPGAAVWNHHAHHLLCHPDRLIALRTWRRGTRPP